MDGDTRPRRVRGIKAPSEGSPIRAHKVVNGDPTPTTAGSTPARSIYGFRVRRAAVGAGEVRSLRTRLRPPAPVEAKV